MPLTHALDKIFTEKRGIADSQVRHTREVSGRTGGFNFHIYTVNLEIPCLRPAVKKVCRNGKWGHWGRMGSGKTNRGKDCGHETSDSSGIFAIWMGTDAQQTYL